MSVMADIDREARAIYRRSGLVFAVLFLRERGFSIDQCIEIIAEFDAEGVIPCSRS